MKEPDSTPWDRILIYFICPYKIIIEGLDDLLMIKSLTMVDPTTRWFKIIKYRDKSESTIENIVDQTWLCRYPRPTIFTSDIRNEFLGLALKTNAV